MSFTREERNLLSAASVKTIIPQNTRLSLNELVQPESDSIAPQDIKQRDALFFDEHLTAFVILQLPQCPEDQLKSYLSRLDLKLEVWVVESERVDRTTGTSAAPQDLVFSATARNQEDPIALISQDDDDLIYMNLIWDFDVALNRPQVPISVAQTVLVPRAKILPLEQATEDNVYLEPFKVRTTNLFETLKGSRGFEREAPYLPVSRLDSVLPVPAKEDDAFHLQSTDSYAIPTHPAFIPRVKYSKVGAGPVGHSLVASLDIEIIPFISLYGTILKAQAALSRGSVISLTEDMLPVECQSKDCLTLLYRLEELGPATEHQSTTSTEVLNFLVEATIALTEECHPNIQMRWASNVDFAQSINAHHTPSQSMQRANRPANLSIEGGNQLSAAATASLQQVTQFLASNALTISFVGSNEVARIGRPFTWQILIVNKTNKAAKLAIIPLPRIQRSSTQAQQYAKRHATRSSVASIHQGEGSAGEKSSLDIAQGVIDENIMYAMQHSGAVPPETDIISLTPEMRVGPLGPGQCHECEIKLVAFRTGALMLDAIRVVDLVKEAEDGYGGQGVVTDIRDLPDVIVVDS